MIMTTQYMQERLLKSLISDIVQIVMLDICLVVLMMVLLKTKFVRPITQLTIVSSEIAAGKLDQPIEARGNDEIGVLAQSFLQMRDSIKRQLVELETENAERKRAEKEMRYLRNLLKNIVNSMP